MTFATLDRQFGASRLSAPVANAKGVPMGVHITASVGAGGFNRRPDVESVQRLLAACRLYRGEVDGRCGPVTVDAILSFQRGFMGKPDGRVDANGGTLRRLSTRAGAQGATPTPAARPAATPAGPVAVDVATPNQLLTRTVPRPDAHTMNPGLVAVSPSFMVQTLGKPRESFTSDCQPMTNEKLKRHVVTRDMGRFRVTGLDVAVDSLQAALEDIRVEQPAVHEALGTAGMLCCRLVRGSNTAISNHSWGTAIDFKLNDILDRRGDDKVQVGLTLIAPIMNRHGWYWGAAFRTEDAMHFEASRSLITQWAPRLT